MMVVESISECMGRKPCESIFWMDLLNRRAPPPPPASNASDVCQSGSQVEQDIAGGYVVLTDEQHQLGPLRRECLTMSSVCV